ncbi:unnamed protein product, partial [Urochloa humidicola]
WRPPQCYAQAAKDRAATEANLTASVGAFVLCYCAEIVSVVSTPTAFGGAVH